MALPSLLATLSTSTAYVDSIVDSKGVKTSKLLKINGLFLTSWEGDVLPLNYSRFALDYTRQIFWNPSGVISRRDLTESVRLIAYPTIYPSCSHIFKMPYRQCQARPG
jgi:hypothetical protein